MPHARTVLFGLLVAALSCREPTQAEHPTYLAIVNKILAPAGVLPTGMYRYRIAELSGTLGIDTTFTAAPTDTVIVVLPPASYEVTISDVPPICGVRQPIQYVQIPPGSNTSIVRYAIDCGAALTIETSTDGYAVDPEFLYRLIASDGTGRLGSVGSNDTLRVPAVAAGEYELHLIGIAEHCIVTSDGGAKRRLAVSEQGGTHLLFRVVCSSVADRPRLLTLRGTYAGGVSAFTARAVDPNRDIERYYWDLTDCAMNSVLPKGGRLRRNLLSERTAYQDTVIIAAAFEVGLADSALASMCVAMRVMDQYGNSTPLMQVPLRPGAGRAPVIERFDAYYIGTTHLRTVLTARDPDGDLVGTFVAARLRDGVLSPPDGVQDIGIFSSAGFLGTAIPDFRLGTPHDQYPKYDDYYGIIVYLIDAAGHFSRLEDTQLFR